ncbi:MAG TPA: hypothetical protein VNT01_06960, partial [Symbiobacteriaceae bacterium]|nr:hypothetical protein [Symbiobacteriaceae bacterium]
MRSLIIKAFMVVTALSFSVVSAAGAPEIIADLQANPDLRTDPRQLWIGWAPDGQRLVYVTESRQLMLLDLTDPAHPRPVSARTGYAPRFRPDGKAVAFTGIRTEAGRTLNTLYLQRLDGGAPVDLLPGDLAVQSVSTAKMIHRWLDAKRLSYEEHMGTGIQQLFLLDVPTRTLSTQGSLIATRFQWSANGRRVAGHVTCCPSRFWIWDRLQRQFVIPAESPAGPSQRWFEAFSDDGQQALFTEWTGKQAYDAQARAPLFRLEITTARTVTLAENGILAAWSGDLVAYVKVENTMTLVVAKAQDGQPVWTENLGAVPDRFDIHHWEYQPQFAGPFLFFRAGDGRWRVSPADRKQVQIVYPG